MGLLGTTFSVPGFGIGMGGTKEEEVALAREERVKEEGGMEAEEGEVLEEVGGNVGKTGTELGAAGSRSREGESQEGGEPGRTSTVVPGRRDEGRASRCS